jgi:hypothetical protein
MRGNRRSTRKVYHVTLYSLYRGENQELMTVADRFSWFAALLPPVYALVHGLWLLLAGWLVAALGVGVLGYYAGGEAAFWTYILLALLIGFEAATFRRTRLGRGGWHYRGEIVAADEDLAIVEALRRK